ncbi:hypothetical protein QI300_03225 [Staphylococcus saprophyticus]|nr:hypothetical protein [Staphylococcus saprophyticus]
MTHLTLHEEIYKTRIEYQKIKAERDTLINDIEALREKNERLEEEKDDILLEREYYNNGYKDMTRRGRELESKYTTLTNHIRLKAENNPSVDRYIELNNFVDRLERTNDER